MKRLMLLVALAVAFLVGYAAAAKAWPGVNDRSEWRGYFSNTLDQWGGQVFSSGIPSSVNTANEFINYVESELRSGSTQNKTGAAFIIDYMLGYPWRRDNPPNGNDLMIWETEVRNADASRRVTWSTNFSFTVNSYYQGTGSGSNPRDDAFYYETDTQPAIVFRNPSGTIAAVIKRSCGNIVTNGNYYGFDETFTITGNTTVSNASPSPGQTVTWRHYIHNNGPTATASEWWAVMDGSSGQATGLSSFARGPTALNVNQTLNVWNENFTVPANAPAGTRYCRQVGWDPINSSGARNGRGAQSCITVTVPAKLRATMSASPTHILAGDTVTFTPGIAVVSAGNTVTANCTITRTVTPPSGVVQVITPAPSCVDSSGNANITVGAGGVTLRPNAYATSSDLAVGSRVCDTMVITNPVGPLYFNAPGDATATACAIVAKTPYVQFMGNDVWAGGGFSDVNPACNTSAKITTSSNTLSDGSVAGSYTEYGAFALGQITQFGSADKALLNAGAPTGKMLTFSNTNSSSLGFYGAPQHCINSYINAYSSTPLTALPSPYDLGGQAASTTRRVSGPHTFHGAVRAGTLQIYLVQGDVTIDGNITYPGSYGSLAEIPSLIIIATGNIFVQNNVTQMDGVYVAHSTFNTCSNAPPVLSVNDCNQQLVINGAVIAGNISLMRTFGADGNTSASRKNPAEVFYFTPEVYLRNALNANGGNTVKIVDEKDLPPRY